MTIGSGSNRRIGHFRNILAAACQNNLQKNKKYNGTQNLTLK
jgi:hypothetical protein